MNFIKDIIYSLVNSVWYPRNSAIVLFYHSVSDTQMYSAIHPDMFAQQLKLLHDQGFNVVSLETLAEYRKKGSIPPKTVCITFDDGYLDNYTNAFPVLKQYNFPATIFVITSVIGGTWSARNNSFAMLSEIELKGLEESGIVTVEPHTVMHPKLPKISIEQMEQEIRDSKAALEQLLGKSCVQFAYPFGRYSPEAIEVTKRVGVHYAYTVEEGLVRPDTDDFLLHRNGINRTISLTQFRGVATYGRLSRARLFKYLKNLV